MPTTSLHLMIPKSNSETVENTASSIKAWLIANAGEIGLQADLLTFHHHDYGLEIKIPGPSFLALEGICESLQEKLKVRHGISSDRTAPTTKAERAKAKQTSSKKAGKSRVIPPQVRPEPRADLVQRSPDQRGKGARAILLALHDNGALSAHDVAGLLGLHRTSANQTIMRLVSKGLIEKVGEKQNPGRKQILYAPTPTAPKNDDQ